MRARGGRRILQETEALMSRSAARSAPDPRPTLRDSVDETLAEHGRLRAAVDTMASMTAFPPRHGSMLWSATMLERLDGLQSALAQHFGGEEQRRLFESIEDANPATAPAGERLRAQHRRLLLELDGLRRDLAGGDRGAPPPRRWVRRARAFLKALAQHEETENALLLDAVERVDPAED
jgi:hypothetical protein